MERGRTAMRNRAGTGCMILGAALILAALSLFLWNRREAELAGTASEELLPLVVERIIERRGREPGQLPEAAAKEMTVVEIDGLGYIGFLSIPTLTLELPVLAEWDEAGLNTAPCRYSGATGTDDLVLCAHNYERHFGRLTELERGDEVLFTDMDGVTSRYLVAAQEVLEPTAIEEMTAGDYGLTLFTCTYGGASRVTVRCERAEEKEK